MRIVGTCPYCENGTMETSVCPHCWGTTVSKEALAEAKEQLQQLRKKYAAQRAHNKTLRGKARGMGGYELSKIGRIGGLLRTEIDRIENEKTKNKAVARAVGAAAGGY